MDVWAVIGFIFGSILGLFVPGLFWSFLLFPKRGGDTIERLALSFGLSMVLAPLAIYSANKLLGIGITWFSAIIILVLLSLAPLTWRFVAPRIPLHRAAKRASQRPGSKEEGARDGPG